MRFLLITLVVAFGLAGCVTPEGGDTPPFDRSCPVYHASPGNPSWGVRPWVHDADSENPEVADDRQRDKWIVTPTLLKENPYEYANGTLDFIELSIDVELIVDAELWFVAYESAKGEPAVYNSSRMTKEEFMATTGPQVQFRDMNEPGRVYTGRLEFGPAYGNNETDFVRDVGGTYRVEWTNGQGEFDPHNLRVDAFFRADADKDPETDSVVIFDIKATLWYRHHDCV